MKLVYPSVELWTVQNRTEHLCKCARVCYASEKEGASESLVNRLMSNGHKSMFRHISRYYITKAEDYKKLIYHINFYKNCSYISYEIINNVIYISTNEQFILEHQHFVNIFNEYEVAEKEFIAQCPSTGLIRLTFAIESAISTSRELNRTSPNNIAEQSTRYVNFGKKGVRIAIPHFYLNLTKWRQFICRLAWRIDEYFYNLVLKWGLPPQDAREFLPLTAYTKVAYTYTINEWKHILDLRYFEITGKAHPNAKYIAGEINNFISEYLENIKNYE